MEYIEHLSWILLLKFLDDIDLRETNGGSNATVPKLSKPYRWRDWAAKDSSHKSPGSRIGGIRSPEELMQFIKGSLFAYLAEIGNLAGQSLLSAIFSDGQVVICKSPTNLRDVIDCIDQVDFSRAGDRHTISHVYEELLKRLGSENKLAGEFYTPRPVIRFMISVINPELGETVYDPAAGSCGFLVECFDAMMRNARTIQRRHTLQSRTFYGNEKKRVPALMGLINMFLHGINAPHVTRQNSLDSPAREAAKKFDIILTNPPFGGIENRQIQQRFPVKSRATELLFLQRIFDQLSINRRARCGIVLTDGFLFRSGPFAAIKRRLIEEFNLFMVVSLPSGAFAPYSDVKTAVLFFDRSGPTKKTLFCSMPAPASTAGKFSLSRPVCDDDFAFARTAYEIWKSSRSKRSKTYALPSNCEVISADEIAARGFNLSPRCSSRTVNDIQRPPEILSDLIVRVDRIRGALSRLQTLVLEEVQ
jgi:type I restriction enzyme M protein